MSVIDHIDSLRSKHAYLEQALGSELHRPMPDPVEVQRLKREKLRIKDEIRRLNGGSATEDVPQASATN